MSEFYNGHDFALLSLIVFNGCGINIDKLNSITFK